VLDFQRWTDKRLTTTFRIAKTRLYPFFRSPHAMIALRNERERRELLIRGRIVEKDNQRPTGLVS